MARERRSRPADPNKNKRARPRGEAPGDSSAELAALIKSVAARDPAAEASLARMHELTVGTLTALARSMLRDPNDAEEIVCDTYVQAWQTAGSYSSARGTALAWLVTICRSRALDRLRQRKLRVATAQAVGAEQDLNEVGVDRDSPDQLLSLMQTGTAVHAALAKLSADKRRMVELAFLEGLSHQEISDRMQVPLGTVKSHVRRSLQTLRDALASEAR
jgi:RNA polymerase sigma-70 factor (ECF subfamily)